MVPDGLAGRIGWFSRPWATPGDPLPARRSAFAQGIGLLVSGAALTSWLVLGQAGIAQGLLGVLVLFAVLEAVLGFCAGCLVFRQLMRWGGIPQETCERCNHLTLPARNTA